MPSPPDGRVADDAGFFGLREGPEGLRFTVRSHLSRFDQGLYGGAAVGICMTALEQVTGREAVWVTTQFLSNAVVGADVDVRVEVLAEGRRSSQARITATSSDGVVFAALGAAGVHRGEGMSGTFERSPTVTSPDSGGVGFPAVVERLDVGWLTVSDMRIPEVLDHPDAGPGRLCVWVRRKDRRPLTPAVAAYLADVVPLSIARACGVTGAGTSVDNTVRVGHPSETEWALVDMRPHLAVGGYGHGTAHLWSEDGVLLATVSQSAAMSELPFDPLTHTGRG